MLGSVFFAIALLAASCSCASVDCPKPLEIEPFSRYQVAVPIPEEFFSLPIQDFFNSSKFNAVGSITSSSSTTTAVQVIGFFYQEFKRDNTKVGDPVILFRHTPSAPGEYTISISINGALVGKCAFSVSGGSNRTEDGFVSVGQNKQHFAIANQSLFLIGENLAWTDSRGLESWENYMRNLSDHGANYIRVWLTDGWTDLFIETSLGNYSLVNTWNIDQVLEMAQKFQIKVLMCIESFNLFCSAPPPMPCNWDESVYNKKNGGPLSSGGDFFTNQQAKELFQQRLRYIVARYSFSSSVLGWEFFNEVDLTDNYDPSVQVAWLKEMSAYIRSIDPYSHLVSTSITMDDTPIYELDQMSFSMVHTYGSYNSSDMADNSRYWNGRMSQEYAKPGFIAETGESFPDVDNDPTGIGFHNSLWASVATASAGTSMFWWWDSWIAKDNLLYHVAAIRNFTKEINWHKLKWAPVTTTAPKCSDVSPSLDYSCEKLVGSCSKLAMRGYCCHTCFNCSTSCVGAPMNGWRDVAPSVRMLATVGSVVGEEKSGNTAAVLWIQNSNNTYTAQNVSLPASERLVVRTIYEFDIPSFPLGPSFRQGCYSIKWFDTYSGEIISDIQMQLGCGGPEATCSISIMSIPTFTRDIAAIISRKDAC